MAYISTLPLVVLFLFINNNPVQGRDCWFKSNGYTKQFYCSPYEKCCGNGCCEMFSNLYRMWYFWLCILFLIVFCSGGGLWSCKHCVQRRLRHQGNPAFTCAPSPVPTSEAPEDDALINHKTAKRGVIYPSSSPWCQPTVHYTSNDNACLEEVSQVPPSLQEHIPFLIVEQDAQEPRATVEEIESEAARMQNLISVSRPCGNSSRSSASIPRSNGILITGVESDIFPLIGSRGNVKEGGYGHGWVTFDDSDDSFVSKPTEDEKEEFSASLDSISFCPSVKSAYDESPLARNVENSHPGNDNSSDLHILTNTSVVSAARPPSLPLHCANRPSNMTCVEDMYASLEVDGATNFDQYAATAPPSGSMGHYPGPPPTPSLPTITVTVEKYASPTGMPPPSYESMYGLKDEQQNYDEDAEENNC